MEKGEGMVGAGREGRGRDGVMSGLGLTYGAGDGGTTSVRTLPRIRKGRSKKPISMGIVGVSEQVPESWCVVGMERTNIRRRVVPRCATQHSVRGNRKNTKSKQHVNDCSVI